LIDRAASRFSYVMKPSNEAPKQDHLCLSCGLFLLALESDQRDGVEINGEERVVDRGGQIALVPPLLTKQLIDGNQQPNIENIETGISTYRHGLRLPPWGHCPCSYRHSITCDIYTTMEHASTNRVENKSRVPACLIAETQSLCS
jgi:hypothetical protein